jgi:integrase
LTTLKAVLNRAVEDGLVEGPGEWAKVKPFKDVEASRARFLEEGELRRLLNVCEPDFRDLVASAVHTGARYSELAALRVGDYLPEAQAVHFATTKSGKPRNVFLSEEGASFLDRLTAGRGANDVLLTRHDGSSWGRNHQARRMREACKQAGINPPAGFHQLRHSYASVR